MAKGLNSQLASLMIVELLRKESCEQHTFTAKDICIYLAGEGVQVSEYTVCEDIKLLRNFGFEIFDKRIGHKFSYYMDDRDFSLPELKILIDSILSCAFLSEKKRRELIFKVASLGGRYIRDALLWSIASFLPLNGGSEKLFYWTDTIFTAIKQRRMISFYLFQPDEKGRPIYKNNGTEIIVSPVSLFCEYDQYYLLGTREGSNKLETFRVDRMEKVCTLNKKSSVTQLNFNPAKFSRKFWGATDSTYCTVSLCFNGELIGDIFDNFGKDTKILKLKENIYTADINVPICDKFFGYVFSFGGKMRISAPDAVVKQYRNMLELSFDTNV